MSGTWSSRPRIPRSARTAWAAATSSAWRRWGHPRLLPLNVTVSPNYRCNFTCLTCNVYDRKVVELTAEEWGRVFASMGPGPMWMTFSGGEPFLRKDLPDIILSAVEHCRPSIVNIPSNGWFTRRVVDGMDRLCRSAPHTQFVVNLSFDHHEPARHDHLRDTAGSYGRLVETLAGLQALGHRNLTVGCHTVISRGNEDEFPAIAEGLAALGADSYIAECAEERVELQTLGTGISPTAVGYARAAGSVLAADGVARGRVAQVARAFREEYYGRVIRYLDGDEAAMPVCHAGFLSTHIGAEGDVWSCCVLSHSFGNVRDAGFDFKAVWFGARAGAFRSWMRSTRCACPLANAAYTNLLVEPRTALRAAGRVVLGPRMRARPLPVPSGRHDHVAGVPVTLGRRP